MTTATDYSKLFQTMNSQQLQTLLNQAANEMSKREKEIADNYGGFFTSIVGVEQIFRLNVVPADQLNLLGDSKYYAQTVKPSMLKDAPAVRGITSDNRPFIAIQIEMLNPETREVVDKVVELVFKRYSLDFDGKKGALHENNYVTALHNAGENGTFYNSTLYTSGSMSTPQIEAVRDLLEGKEIKAPTGYYLIRKA